MQLQPKSRAVWEQLPDDMWAAIFTCFKTSSAGQASTFEDNLLSYDQPRFLSLQLVCRRFRNIYTRHSRVCSKLFLDRRQTGQHIAVLLEGVRNHISALTRVAASCGSPCVEAVLAVMQGQSMLDRVYVYAASSHVIFLLATFRTLTQCTLSGPRSSFSSINVRPLETLPNLTRLTLRTAIVSGVKALPHLTALTLEGGRTTCSHHSRCVTSLVHLTVSNACVLDFHMHGVLACTRLQSLIVQQGLVQAGRTDSCVSLFNPVFITTGLTELRALTTLVIQGRLKPQHQLFNWVNKLTGLQHLSFSVPFDYLGLSESVAALTNLRTMCVLGIQSASMSQIDVDMDWTAFPFLKSAILRGQVTFSSKMNDLAALRSLEQFEVHDMPGCVHVYQWTESAHWISVNKPECCFRYSVLDTTASDCGENDSLSAESSPNSSASADSEVFSEDDAE